MLKKTKLIGLFSLTACLVSAGIVAPALSQSQEYPTQIQTDSSVTWELKSCAKKTNNVVSCNFSMSSSQDLQYTLGVLGVTGLNKIVDPDGNEYSASKTQVGKRIAGSGIQLTFQMAKNANYATTIDYAEVPVSVSQIILLEIGTGPRSVKFRNVPIINPDGSFTVIPNLPNSDNSPGQPQSPNNSNNRGRLCLPIIGCVIK